MSLLIDKQSAESICSELDLFKVPLTQISLEDGFFTEYRPVSILTFEGPVEFCINSDTFNYIDLANIFLYVRASIQQLMEVRWLPTVKLLRNVISCIRFGPSVIRT